MTNLRTGAKQEYSCAALEAVVSAHEQSKGNWNTWTYDFGAARTAGKTVYCGDFAAQLDV